LLFRNDAGGVLLPPANHRSVAKIAGKRLFFGKTPAQRYNCR
jgi:hypothetical protein